MTRGTACRVWHLALLLLCAGALLVAPASAGAVSSAGCNHRVNDTPGKLMSRAAELGALRVLGTASNARRGPAGNARRFFASRPGAATGG